METLPTRLLRTLALWMVFLIPLWGIAQITVQSVFSPSVVTPGQSSHYQIVISGASDPRLEGTLPQVPGLVLSNRPSVSQNVSIEQGVTTRTITYSFAARPEGQVESITVPPFSLSIDGVPYMIPAATLRVVPESERTRGALELKLNMPEQLYAGQSTPAEIQLWIRNDMRFMDRSAITMLGDAFAQTLGTDDQARQERRMRDGASYTVVTWPTLITPLKAGSHPIEYQMQISYEDTGAARADRGRSFIDPFGMMSRNVSQVMLTDSKVVNVRPLPQDGKPENFTGAIGKFTITANHTNTQTRVGEPVSLRVTVSGGGNFMQMDPPSIASNPDWRSYPPESNFSPSDTLGFQGTATYEFLLTPTVAGELQTPSLQFNYFDPEEGTYKTIEIPGEEVVVAQGGSFVPAQRSAEPAPVQNLKEKKDDLYPIQLLPGKWVANLKVPFTQPQFWATQLSAGLILGSLVGWRIRRRRSLRNPHHAILTGNKRQALHHRREAVAAAKNRDAATFYLHARLALQNASAFRLRHLHPEALDEAFVARALAGVRGNTQLPEAIFRGYDSTRFGGTPPEMELDPASKQVERAVNQLIKGR